MNDSRTAQKEKLVADVKQVMGELEAILRDSASDAGDEVSKLQDKMRDRLRAARGSLTELEYEMVDKAKAAANATDEYVHTRPWTAIGVAAGIGAVIGLLLNRR
jgi:ElaB/YqjD/DUF883 family membrane-anchored ribosome-binding protein